MTILNNKKVYSTVEFDCWANRKDLSFDEKYIIEFFLNKGEKTLEAGTAGGRILLEMKKLGFTSLHGFDFVPEFIEMAKQKDDTHSIVFELQDATNLNYEDLSFQQILYLQQIICSIEDELGRLKAFKEAYRILKSGGTALFSFLSFEVRSKSAIYLPYLTYLRLSRKLRHAKISIQYLPWLKLGGKLNFSLFLDSGPYVYWYKLQEVYQLLREVGFEVVAIGSSYQIRLGRMYDFEKLVNEPIQGMLYFVCKK